jgi:hypothetical protein
MKELQRWALLAQIKFISFIIPLLKYEELSSDCSEKWQSIAKASIL